MSRRQNRQVWQFSIFLAQGCHGRLSSVAWLQRLLVDLAECGRLTIGRIGVSRMQSGVINVHTIYGQATIGVAGCPRSRYVIIRVMSAKRFRPVVISDFLMERLRPVSLQRCGECSWQLRSRRRS